MRSFPRERREEELRVLRLLTSHFAEVGKKCWLMSIVTKQDLWWPIQDRVEEHYRHGKYGAEIAALLSRLAPAGFRHEFAFASLVIENFVTAKEECLRATARGYDKRCQVNSLRRLIEILDSLKDWEEEP